MTGSPGDLRAAERALESVRAIRQVVHAVWTLARAQQPRLEAAAGDASAYVSWVEELVDDLGGTGDADGSDVVLWVVVGPERPFCGGLARRLLEQVPPRGKLVLVGRRLVDALTDRDPIRARVVSRLSAAVGPEDVDSRAREIAAALLELDVDGPVSMLHPLDGGTTLHAAPLLPGAGAAARGGPETYSPPSVVLGAAVHEALSGRLIVGLAEGLRTEVRARLVAADVARQDCDRRIEALTHQWRVLRQDAITGELLELVAGRLAGTGTH